LVSFKWILENRPDFTEKLTVLSLS
jgi:hypothetical protein